MGVYTRFKQVLDADGEALSVREGLSLINATVEEILTGNDDDFDADTRWAITWFEQTGFADGDFGTADTLSKSKVTAVSSLVEAGIIVSKAGKVRLLRPADPRTARCALALHSSSWCICQATLVSAGVKLTTTPASRSAAVTWKETAPVVQASGFAEIFFDKMT
jgi:adenine-specific DNA methylase